MFILLLYALNLAPATLAKSPETLPMASLGGDFSNPARLRSALNIPGVALYAWGIGRGDDNEPLFYKYPYFGKITVDPLKLGQCFAVAASNSEFPLSMGKEQMSCQSFSGELLPKKDWPPIIDYLSGSQRRCDYVSGNEDRLYQWVLAQPDNSIDPLKIFQKSFSLNRGNLWNAILTIHQVLRPTARFNVRQRYGSKIEQNTASRFFNKLMDIRGDLVELKPGELHGDHPGSWYRIWGSMLMILVFMEDDTQLNSCRPPGPMPGTLAEVVSVALFYLDERILKAGREADLGKFRTDKNAALAIPYFFYTMANYSLLASVNDDRLRLQSAQECKDRIYLNKDIVTYDDVPLRRILHRPESAPAPETTVAPAR